MTERERERERERHTHTETETQRDRDMMVSLFRCRRYTSTNKKVQNTLHRDEIFV